jgi:predicted RNA-binding Zn ribbon-like protein
MSDAAALDLIGGHAGIDFVNTLAATQERPAEFLHTYADLVAWAQHAGILSAASLERLQDRAGEQPARAAAILSDALQLRADLDETLRSRLADVPAGIRDHYLQALRHAELREAGEQYAWAWPEPAADLDTPVWLLASAAVDLLRTAPLERLSTCADCRWLFLDLSRNRSRRWCRMRGCGARAKMRRYRAKAGDS